jgi:hypothetical protein
MPTVARRWIGVPMVMELMATKRGTEDRRARVVILRRQQRLAEAVTFRLHVLSIAVAGHYPGRFDDADLGLTDAIEQLRLEELRRVLAWLPPADENTDGSDDGSDGDNDNDDDGLQAAVDALADALDGTRQAAAQLAHRLAHNSDVVVPITAGRVAMLRRLVARCIPPTLVTYLDDAAAQD